jgi:hypothetical protein
LSALVVSLLLTGLKHPSLLPKKYFFAQLITCQLAGDIFTQSVLLYPKSGHYVQNCYYSASIFSIKRTNLSRYTDGDIIGLIKKGGQRRNPVL